MAQNGNWDDFSEFRVCAKVMISVIFTFFVVHMIGFILEILMKRPRLDDPSVKENPKKNLGKFMKIVRIVILTMEFEILPGLMLFLIMIGSGSFNTLSLVFGVMIVIGFGITLAGNIADFEVLTIIGRVGIASGTAVPLIVAMVSCNYGFKPV